MDPLKPLATLTSSLAFAAAAQGVLPPEVPTPAQINAAEKVCVVQLSRDKRIAAASIVERASLQAVFIAPLLTKTETGVEGEATRVTDRTPGGLLKVAVMPENQTRNEIDRRPVSCEVDGATYPVSLPENIQKRLFSPKPPGAVS